MVFLTEDKHIYRMLYRICPIVSSPHTIVPTHTIHIEDGNCIYLCNIPIYILYMFVPSYIGTFHWCNCATIYVYWCGVLKCTSLTLWQAAQLHPQQTMIAMRSRFNHVTRRHNTYIYIQSGVRFFFKGDCDIAVNVKSVFDAVLRTHDLSIDILWRTLRNEVPSLSRIDHMCSVVSCVTIYV